ncbi:DUF2782 domain-containing protein [Methylogaea oryzae]|uniref:DUF2782 domain-containing protein n=1 Tax=Methylogaea oryzae TaxID=1295382 RepID=A0A8D4VNT2_9GAMM|nr:hypothetical protein MoryE10_05480 [Methylogaea oryzae]
MKAAAKQNNTGLSKAAATRKNSGFKAGRRALLPTVLLAGLFPLAVLAAQPAYAPPPPDIGAANPAEDEKIPPENLQPVDDSVRVVQPEAVPEQPDLPAPVQNGENIEPDITIVKRGKDTIQEYRVNGKLYMVKIIPSIGPAYYLLDTDGDGNMDVRRSNLESGLKTPQWVLFSW